MRGVDRPVVFPLHAIVDGKCACGYAACGRVGKHPAVNWGDLEYGSPAPRPEPGAGVGLKTGAAPKGSGVFVVDLDGDDALTAWEKLGGGAEALSVQTPKGWHLYFEHPGFRIRNSVSDLAKGIDIRGDGGFVVAPGSPHRSGGRYGEPDGELRPAPQWLLAWLQSRPAAAEAQSYPGDVEGPERESRREKYATYLREEAPARGPALRGKGDATLFEVVQRGAYDLALPVDDVFELVRDVYDPRCDPPWGDELEERVQHKAHDAKTKSTRPRFEPLPEDLEHFATGGPPPESQPPGDDENPIAARARGAREERARAVADFEEEAPALPEFPVDVLPSALRDFVLAEAEATQTPIDMSAMLVLGCCAAAIAGKLEIEVERGYREPLNLFVVVALPPAERKSSVFADVFRPLQEAERTKVDAAAPLIAEAQTKSDLLVAQIKRANGQLAKVKPGDEDQTWASNQRGSTPNGGGALQAQIAEMKKRLRDMGVPAEPRLLADDVTMERLAGLMAEQGGRMAVTSAEGTLFGIIAGRYSRSGQASFEVLLKGHAGDEMRVDRQGKDRPAVHLKRPALTLALAVQPIIIQRLSLDPAMKGQGLLGRFLYSLPTSKVGRRRIEVEPVPERVRAAYHGVVTALASVPTLQELAVRGRPVDGVDIDQILRTTTGELPTIGLSAEALVLHRAFRAEIEPRLVGDLAEFAEWGGKWAGAVARIAGVLHCVDRGPRDEVAGATMSDAIVLGRYLLAHSAKAFGLMLTPPEETDARAMWDWLTRKGIKRVTMREISRQMTPKVIRSNRARREAAARELVDRGLLVPDGSGWAVAQV